MSVGHGLDHAPFPQRASGLTVEGRAAVQARHPDFAALARIEVGDICSDFNVRFAPLLYLTCIPMMNIRNHATGRVETNDNATGGAK